MVKPNEQTVLQQIYICCKKAFIFIGLFSFFINIFMLTVPIYMMQIFDRVLAGHSYQTLLFLTLIAIFALLILSLLEMVRLRIAGRVSNWLDEVLNPAALLYSPDQVLKGNNYPHMVLKDIAQLKSTLSGNVLFTLFDAPWVPIYLLVIAFIAPLLGFVAALGAAILFAIAVINQKITQQVQDKVNDMSMMNVFNTSNSLRHAEVIQSMGMLKPLIASWQEKNKKALVIADQLNQTSSIIVSSSKFIRLTLQIFILALGAYLVLINQITAGMMIAASILMSRALSPLDQAIGTWKQFQSSKQILERLKNHFQVMQEREGGIVLPKPKGLISIEELHFSGAGQGNKMIINGINLKIKPGEILVLIGPSAAGKTTLARLICGVLKPSSGIVRLDDADVYQWERSDFGRHIGYLPQDIELFNDSIKANIARLGNIDDEAVIKAAQMAGCHSMILNLPNGYETIIQPNNVQLSGGQKQRIALARALYGQPQLIVLDEPNSNLDNEGEIALVNALVQLKKSKVTVVIISHKPNLLQCADTIVVLNEGRIQMEGGKEKILARLQQIKTNYQQRSGYGMG